MLHLLFFLCITATNWCMEKETIIKTDWKKFKFSSPRVLDGLAQHIVSTANIGKPSAQENIKDKALNNCLKMNQRIQRLYEIKAGDIDSLFSSTETQNSLSNKPESTPDQGNNNCLKIYEKMLDEVLSRGIADFANVGKETRKYFGELMAIVETQPEFQNFLNNPAKFDVPTGEEKLLKIANVTQNYFKEKGAYYPIYNGGFHNGGLWNERMLDYINNNTQLDLKSHYHLLKAATLMLLTPEEIIAREQDASKKPAQKNNYYHSINLHTSPSFQFSEQTLEKIERCIDDVRKETIELQNYFPNNGCIQTCKKVLARAQEQKIRTFANQSPKGIVFDEVMSQLKYLLDESWTSKWAKWRKYRIDSTIKQGLEKRGLVFPEHYEPKKFFKLNEHLDPEKDCSLIKAFILLRFVPEQIKQDFMLKENNDDK